LVVLKKYSSGPLIPFLCVSQGLPMYRLAFAYFEFLGLSQENPLQLRRT
jgi:hypothetical protein